MQEGSKTEDRRIERQRVEWMGEARFERGGMTTPTVELAEWVAALVLDPRHRCTPLCLCNKVKDIPHIAEAIRRLEYQLQSLARAGG